VHVSHEDATAYARWVGAELPSEAEWEFAARGGLEGAEFTWGDDKLPGGKVLANTWGGSDFPWRRPPEDRYERTSPVGSFPPNGYGLHDMAGNVWEWTEDWYTAGHLVPSSCCGPTATHHGDRSGSLDPGQPQFPVPRKVLKGGSFLCADTYCRRYRPAARRPQTIDTGMSHVGFRCMHRGADPEGGETP
jgi:formylglycine-generating enzyme required for sulfatase activity